MVDTLEPPLLVNSREAARLLGISERTLFTLRAAGKIPCVKLGAAVRFDRMSLREFVSVENRSEAAACA